MNERITIIIFALMALITCALIMDAGKTCSVRNYEDGSAVTICNNQITQVRKTLR